MDRLIVFHRDHMVERVSPEVEAAWLHHRFTQIHPFQDGNGRVVRALATLVLVKAGWFPLVVTRDDRERYINALEAADGGELRPLVEFVSTLQRRAFVQALGLAQTTLQETERIDQVIRAIRASWHRWQVIETSGPREGGSRSGSKLVS